jgi:hypothetical protein
MTELKSFDFGLNGFDLCGGAIDLIEKHFPEYAGDGATPVDWLEKHDLDGESNGDPVNFVRADGLPTETEFFQIGISHYSTVGSVYIFEAVADGDGEGKEQICFTHAGEIRKACKGRDLIAVEAETGDRIGRMIEFNNAECVALEIDSDDDDDDDDDEE